jgi:hypothetical protein
LGLESSGISQAGRRNALLILCGEKTGSRSSYCSWTRGEIRAAEYLVELPPREMLEAKLHEAIWLARGQVERSSET